MKYDLKKTKKHRRQTKQALKSGSHEHKDRTATSLFAPTTRIKFSKAEAGFTYQRFNVETDGCNPSVLTAPNRPDILASCVHFTVTHLCLSIGADDL